ncbi:MAG: hypothetical protein A3F90_11715 [Deltaproteobacteria bacterium RIFCSPLOWO2_12_FULL_60_19]|nr:MAG: hypothetical protein A3F90_11715 [Deltaproteobacteria bacterium RIFCSPLOWO2_12_FULL_60_19]
MTGPAAQSLTDTSGAGPLPSDIARAPFKKALGLEVLMVGLSYPARFQLAVGTGFEAIEMEALADLRRHCRALIGSRRHLLLGKNGKRA